MTAAGAEPDGRLSARLVLATTLFGLTGLAFCVAGAILIYGVQVNPPPVAQLFGVIAVILLAIGGIHFAVAYGIRSHRRWAPPIGTVVAVVVISIAGYIGIDQLTRSDDAFQVSAPYLATAAVYAVSLFSLLAGVRSIRSKFG